MAFNLIKFIFFVVLTLCYVKSVDPQTVYPDNTTAHPVSELPTGALPETMPHSVAPPPQETTKEPGNDTATNGNNAHGNDTHGGTMSVSNDATTNSNNGHDNTTHVDKEVNATVADIEATTAHVATIAGNNASIGNHNESTNGTVSGTETTVISVHENVTAASVVVVNNATHVTDVTRAPEHANNTHVTTALVIAVNNTEASHTIEHINETHVTTARAVVDNVTTTRAVVDNVTAISNSPEHANDTHVTTAQHVNGNVTEQSNAPALVTATAVITKNLITCKCTNCDRIDTCNAEHCLWSLELNSQTLKMRCGVKPDCPAVSRTGASCEVCCCSKDYCNNVTLAEAIRTCAGGASIRRDSRLLSVLLAFSAVYSMVGSRR